MSTRQAEPEAQDERNRTAEITPRPVPPERPAARKSVPRWTFLPARYEAIVVGSGLLMLASAASVPLGPAARTVGRELLTVVATGLGLHFLIVACLPRPLVHEWDHRRPAGRVVVLGMSMILALGTATVFAGAVNILLYAAPSQAYVTDIVSFTHMDAQLALAGKNPYTSDAMMRVALARFPDAQGTPLRGEIFGTGYDHPDPTRVAAVQRQYVRSPESVPDAFDPRALHSYPALSFLVYVPYLWLGGANILALNVMVYWLLFAWLVWLAPVGWRHWGALVGLASMTTMAASLIVANEIICIALLLAAWHWRDRRWLSAALLGLACAYKQYAWLFAPFFLVDVLTERGPRETVKRGAILLGVFLVPNLPYIIASPGAWFASMWLPMSGQLFATGMGIIGLSIGHIVPYAPPFVYATLELLAMGALLWMGMRWRQRLGDAMLLLPLIPLFFAFRSLPSYFAFAPWLALYAVNRLYAREVTPPESPVLAAATRAVHLVRERVGRGKALLIALGTGRPATEARAADAHRPLTLPERSLSQAYRPTGWAALDRLLARVDRISGGRAAWFQRLVSYLIIGGCGALVNLACFWLLYDHILSPAHGAARWPIAFVVATEISILVNFVLNDRLTFRDLPGHRRLWLARCARFHVTSAGGTAVTLVISYGLLALAMPAVAAQAIALLLATTFNFVFHHVYTYRAPWHRAPTSGDAGSR